MNSQITRFRAFNRFYTAVIGILDKGYLDSPFSLTEVRILYELNYAPGGITAKALTELLKLDKGYLSRILKQFDKQQLIAKHKTGIDGRLTYLRLTDKGKAVYKPLDTASQQQAAQLLDSLSTHDVVQLLKHMDGIQAILSKVTITL